MIAGNGVVRSGARDLLLRFYERTKIPVLTTMNAVDLVQDSEKIGFIGTYGNRVANMIVSQCDLVISIGARLGLRQVGSNVSFFAPNAKLIRVDIDQFELSRTIKVDEEKYLEDAREFLNRLLTEDIPVYENWNRICFEAKKMLEPYDKQLGNLCLEKISDMLPENPIVAVDIGQNQCWAAQSLTLKGHRGHILIGGSYGSMGCGLPYAIGAAIGLKSTVFCITGDGGLQMNIQDLQTVFVENLPVKIIVINNRTLGKISEIQRGSYNNRFLITTSESGYVAPDFQKIASAYGIKSTTVSDYQSLDSCIDWFKDSDPCLINIILPDDTLLLPKMNWNEKDMKPALDADITSSVLELLSGE